MTGDLAPCHDVPSPDLPYNTDANLLVKRQCCAAVRSTKSAALRAVYAVPQCDAASYTVLLKLRVVPFDVFHCGTTLTSARASV